MEFIYEEMNSPEGKNWNKLCSPLVYDEGYVKLGPVKGVYSKSYLSFINRIKNFKIRDDDIFVCSFPKAGTTWTQALVYLIGNNLDYDKAKIDINQRFPYFELRANWSPKLHANILKNILLESPAKENQEKDLSFFLDSFNIVDSLKSPRFIKSHLHHSLLPNELIQNKKTKIIYIARNPMDTCVSFYHHSCLLDGYSGTLEEFVKSFVTDNVFCSPYWAHLKEFWNLRNNPNVLFLKYEDMKKDLSSVIRQTALFLGKNINTSEIERLKNYLSFESMKKNPALNYENVVENLRKIHGRTHSTTFMRKGQVGNWKEEFTPGMIEMFAEWMDKNKIEGLYD